MSEPPKKKLCSDNGGKPALTLGAPRPHAGSGRFHFDGVGGPHIGPKTIWPMAIIMRALTSTSDSEIADALTTLKKSAAVPDAGAWLMHEAFEAADAASYTRPWFAWCNSLLGSLLVKLSKERPHLVGIK